MRQSLIVIILSFALFFSTSAQQNNQITSVSVRLDIAINHPDTWGVIPGSISGDNLWLVSAGTASRGGPAEDQSYLKFQASIDYDLVNQALGRVVNSVDAASRIAAQAEAYSLIAERTEERNNVSIAIVELAAGNATEPSLAVFVSPYTDNRYSVGILESGSTAQYASDLPEALEIFSSIRRASNAELVADLSAVNFADAPISNRVSGSGYVITLPSGYAQAPALDSLTSLFTLGADQLTYYGYQGETSTDPYPLIVVGPDLNTGFLTALSISSAPRRINLAGRAALVQEGTTSLGNFVNVAVRANDNGAYWSVAVFSSVFADADLSDYAYMIASKLESSASGRPLYIGESATFDAENNIDTGAITLAPGAPQILGFSYESIFGGMNFTFLYGDAEGDASEIQFSLISSDTGRAPAAATLELTDTPEQQQQGIASIDFTWYCDRTYSALYTIALADSARSPMNTGELEINCGRTYSAYLLSGLATGGAPGEPIELAYEDSVNGQLRSGENAVYSFQASAGDQIHITMRSFDFDPFFELYYEGASSSLTYAPSDGGFTEMYYNVTQDGTYIIQARGDDRESRGSFGLSLDLVSSGTVDYGSGATDSMTYSGTRLTYGDTFSEEVPDLLYNQYVFEGNAGDVVTIRVDSEDFDGYIELYDGLNYPVGFSDDFNGLNPQIDILLTITDTYTILVSGYDIQAGDVFEISLSQDPDAPRPEILALDEGTLSADIAYGTLVQASLSDDYMEFRFEGSSGDEVTIKLSSQYFDTYLELYDPNNRLAAENDDYDNLNSQIDYTLRVDGVYTIRARGYDTSANGPFSLLLNLADESDASNNGSANASSDPFANALDIVYNTSWFGEILPDAVAVYRFEGSSGDRATIAVDSDEFDPYIELYDSSGALVAENDNFIGSGAVIRTNLTKADIYYIVVRSAEEGGSGWFDIRFTQG